MLRGGGGTGSTGREIRFWSRDLNLAAVQIPILAPPPFAASRKRIVGRKGTAPSLF